MDGLRAVAAVFIVIVHVVVASSPDLEAFISGRRAGQEWVIVFFVLSGFVLSLAAADGAEFDAGRYYPTRLLRLYVPVWAALLFAAAAHELVHHAHVAGATPWLNAHAIGWTVADTFYESTLVFRGGDYYYTSVLWSLRPEVLFSLLLPIYLLWAARVRVHLVVGGTLIAMVVVGDDYLLVYYMLTFMLGVALAFNRQSVRTTMTGPKVQALTFAASAILVTAIWWMPEGRLEGLAFPLVAAGAAGLVAVAIAPGGFARFLELAPLRMIGRRAFSLYLVHEPIIVSVAFAMGGRPGSIALLASSTPFIVAATVLFYRYVERPSHGAARRIGARASAGLRGMRTPASFLRPGRS